jgi:topoisomerase-4 subunit A
MPSNYNEGRRGGRIRCRARIRKEDNKTLVISEIPFGTTTASADREHHQGQREGQDQGRHIEDNTAPNAEIAVHLAAGVSPDNTIDALYAFTDCELSIAPNAVVIENDKPRFVGVNELLRISTQNTLRLLELELKIKQGELEEQLALRLAGAHLHREEGVPQDRGGRDLGAGDRVHRQRLEAPREGAAPRRDRGGYRAPHRDQDQAHLASSTASRPMSTSRGWRTSSPKCKRKLDAPRGPCRGLLQGAEEEVRCMGRERKTELRTFDTIVATKVAVANRKLYVDREGRLHGLEPARRRAWTSARRSMTSSCSAINGTMLVTKVADKKFIGKGVLHVAVWKKGDERTIYHMVYQDGSQGPFYMKRFAVTGITRDKEYDLTNGAAKAAAWSTSPPTRTAPRRPVRVNLRPRPNLRKAQFDIDFAQMAVKGRGSKGNLLTRHIVQKISRRSAAAAPSAPSPSGSMRPCAASTTPAMAATLGRFKR